MNSHGNDEQASLAHLLKSSEIVGAFFLFHSTSGTIKRLNSSAVGIGSDTGKGL